MFQYTTEGYLAAVKFLEEINHIPRELSLDGYTIVALANSLKKKLVDKESQKNDQPS